MGMLRRKSCGVVCLLVALSTTGFTRIPESVRVYEQLESQLPQSNFDLNLCKLVEKRGTFYATPQDREAKECDLTNVHLAYGGWCAAGFLDKTGVHFSQSLMPLIEVVEYTDGTVVYVQNYLKSFSTSSSEDEQAALEFLNHLPQKFDVRGAKLPLFPPEWESSIPLRKER